MSEEVWHLVKDTPKVTGFIGNQRPQEVTPPQIDDLRKSIVEGAVKPKPRVTFEAGDEIRVIDGAFANFSGTVEEVKPDKQKLKVKVSIFGRATPVELDFAKWRRGSSEPWQENHRLRQAAACRPARPTRRRPSAPRSASTASTSWRSARSSTPRPQGEHMIIPVVITVYSDRSFTFILKTPPASVLLKKAAGLRPARSPARAPRSRTRPRSARSPRSKSASSPSSEDART